MQITMIVKLNSIRQWETLCTPMICTYICIQMKDDKHVLGKANLKRPNDVETSK